MGKRRRAWLLIAFAVASLAAVLQPVPAPPNLWADHADDNPGTGWEWVSAADQVETTDNYWHWNTWECKQRATAFAHGCDSYLGRASASIDGTPNPTRSRPCHARGTDKNDANSNGCNNGHADSGGWEWISHSTGNKVPGSTEHKCPVRGNELVADPSHCGTWVESCPAGSDPAVEHRHTGSAPAGASGWHLGCVPSHDLCRPGAANTVTASARPGGHHPARQMPGCDEPVECPTGQHKHGTEACHADHAPPPCIAGLSSEQTGTWQPDHPGHDPVTLPGCVQPVLADCPSGQHAHAAAVPGGHQGCRTAHTAPSCTWNTAGTWTPGHGGAAGDGHTTTTGMRVCVSIRHFCADVGSSNIIADTVDRQTSDFFDGRGRGMLPDGYHRDRIPHPTNLRHAQFLPGFSCLPLHCLVDCCQPEPSLEVETCCCLKAFGISIV